MRRSLAYWQPQGCASEALTLQLNELTPDGLLIRATKFKKDRLVPLHVSTRMALERYLIARSKMASVNQSLFLSPTGTEPKYPTVITVFLSLVRRLGLRGVFGFPGLCLLVLCLVFVVCSLVWCR